ncbi:nucleolar protein 10 [Acrodontium crateriforme]|uniref:Nucleolar protein 10 n=1 Tax=Acrodontium crateriforme TaxID=150365 RepID=A0AAQ3RBF1_9PEZI|nr:nucleolar protein 10 [Acrodontium crateriforme]
MKLSNPSTVPVYTIAGANTARPLPEWLARKRKRSLKKDSEYANRIELLQDFEFEEASSCVRVSEDGEWVMSTGTYKPQIHTHYLPHLSLSYARHTNALNETFTILSSDYTKSLHLQSDRVLEFHTAGGLHYSARIPRYGRDLVYNRRTAEALVPAVGINADGNGEVYRLNLEIGRFMKGYEVDVGGDEMDSMGGGALQGSINVGAVNCAAVAEHSHGLLAFGTSLGTVELWDARSRNRVSALGPPPSLFTSETDSRPEITALEFHRSGLNLATGSSNGIIHTYDLRSPVPLLKKDQGFDFPIKTLKYLPSSSLSSEKMMSADKRAIKIWDSATGDHWTSMEPAVDLNHVEWVPDSGMLLTANEGRQQHAFFIPQLGPAPKWCAFLDNLVEEMAEDADDPNAFNSAKTSAGEVYDNYKFLDMTQLRELSLDHLVGQTNLLRPYMHGYFVAQKLYEQARLLTNPDLAEQQRQKTIQEKINKERESRIRGNKKIAVKVNRRLAEKLAAKEEANEKRKALRVLKQGGDEPRAPVETAASDEAEAAEKPAKGLMGDDRFTRLFEDEDFEIDETSREFAMHNPSTVPNASTEGRKPRGLTAVEEDELDERRGSSDESGDSDGDAAEEEAAALRARQQAKRRNNVEEDNKRVGSANYKKTGKSNKFKEPRMQVSSSTGDFKKQKDRHNKSFGDLASSMPTRDRKSARDNSRGGVVGEKEITFAPSKSDKKGGRPRYDDDAGGQGRKMGRGQERRSASGNFFRKM